MEVESYRIGLFVILTYFACMLMSSRHIHVVLCVKFSSFKGGIQLLLYMNHFSHIHFSTIHHISFLDFLAVMNMAAVNVDRQIPF